METQRRKLDIRIVYFFAALLALTVGGGVYYGRNYRAQAPQRVEAHIKSWFDRPRIITQVLMERYGPPNVLAPGVATWYEKGPWKRITVHGDSPDTFLEQTVGYWVPPDAAPALREFGHGLRFDAAKEELSATSGDEALNYLALNLANEIASAKRSAAEAGDIYERTAKLAASGKSSPYLDGLLFTPYRPVPQERWETWSREIGY